MFLMKLFNQDKTQILIWGLTDTSYIMNPARDLALAATIGEHLQPEFLCMLRR
jgi:hypothetical protein